MNPTLFRAKAAFLRTLVPTAMALSTVALVTGCQSNAPSQTSSGEPSAKPSQVAAASATPAAAPAAPQGKTYGAPITETAATALSNVLENPRDFAGKTVLVDGDVRSACSRKGCWMEIATSLDKAAPGCRVTFKDYGFFVPTDSQGSKARVQGLVNVTKVEKARVDHLEAEGASFPNKNPDGTATEVQLVATGVELRRG